MDDNANFSDADARMMKLHLVHKVWTRRHNGISLLGISESVMAPGRSFCLTGQHLSILNRIVLAEALRYKLEFRKFGDHGYRLASRCLIRYKPRNSSRPKTSLSICQTT